MTPQELKNSILQLAIQGKLVEQRLEEGTGEELYRQIQEEKQRLIKSGKIKKEKTLPKISEAEKPFEIPESWKWVKLGNIMSVLGGKRIPTGRTLTSENTGHKYIRVSDMKNGSVLTENLLFIPEDIYSSISRYIIQKEDVYITVAGTIGKVGKIPRELDGANLTENANRLVLCIINQDWLIKCLESPLIQSQITDATTKVGQPKLAIKRIQELIFPLPPLAEQQRIVAKIEELLPNIDRYEQAWNRLEDFNKRFPDDMKKSILQMAIQGKLVVQRPEEGTAEELYQHIQAEKLQLIKAEKIKKDNSLPEITEDEEPFDIPENWKWVRLGEITQFQGGYAFKSSTYVPLSNNQVIRLGNVKPNTLLLDEKQVFIPDDIATATIDYKLKENDILVTMTGTRKKRDYFFTLAVSAKDLASRNLFLNQRVGCLRIYGLINIKYLLCVLQNEHIKDLIFAKETGTANQGNIGSEDMKCNILVPLPPLAEQKRIVTKLEEILPLCEKLI